jgi:hypothetical protein
MPRGRDPDDAADDPAEGPAAASGPRARRRRRPARGRTAGGRRRAAAVRAENYDPNTRCVPPSVLGYDLGPYANAATCTWVHESCLRLDDESACEEFRIKLKDEKSEALHASASTAPYHRSEVERLSRIVAESCP